MVECGTRALIDVVFGPHDMPEPEQNAVLCRSLRPDMLLLADRASDGYPLLCKAVATGADVLWRIQNNRTLAVQPRTTDGEAFRPAASRTAQRAACEVDADRPPSSRWWSREAKGPALA